MASFSREAVRCYRVNFDRYVGDSVLTDFRCPPFWTPGEALFWFMLEIDAMDGVLIWKLQVGKGVIDLWNCWYNEYYGLEESDDDI